MEISQMNPPRPNFSGIWKADLAKTKLIGAYLKEILMKIDHAEPKLSVVILFTSTEDLHHRVDFKGIIGGATAENTILGNTWHSRMTWEGDELLTETRVSSGSREFHFRDFWSLSADGKILTQEHRDDDLKGQVTILDKIPFTAELPARLE
jgi:hypothetical protein